MIFKALYTRARSESYSKLRDILTSLELPNEEIACLIINLLKTMIDRLDGQHLSPSCLSSLLFYSGGVPVTVAGSTIKLFFKSYVNFRYIEKSVNKGNRASDDIARLIDNGIESIYYLGELNNICFQYDQKEDKALINELFKGFVIRYLKDLESLYVSVSRILLEYIIKFRFAHAIANSLIEVVKNHDCLNTCSGSIDDLVRCFRRNRRGIKSTSLARAFSYFEEDLKISLSEEAKQELKQSLAMRIRFTPINNSAIRVTATITTYVVLK